MLPPVVATATVFAVLILLAYLDMELTTSALPSEKPKPNVEPTSRKDHWEGDPECNVT